MLTLNSFGGLSPSPILGKGYGAPFRSYPLSASAQLRLARPFCSTPLLSDAVAPYHAIDWAD